MLLGRTQRARGTSSKRYRKPDGPCSWLLLLNLQTGLIDDLLVHGHFARDTCAKRIGPFGDHGKTRLGEFLSDIVAAENGSELRHQPIYDRLRRTRRRVDALKRVGYGIPDSKLFQRGNIGEIGDRQSTRLNSR